MILFLTKFADCILWVLGCVDRLPFKGYLLIANPASLERWLDQRGSHPETTTIGI